MRLPGTVLKVVVASVLASGSLFTMTAVQAAASDSAPDATLSRAGKNALETASGKSSQAMLEVRAARVALFNGFPEEGLELVTTASENLEQASTALRVYRLMEGDGVEDPAVDAEQLRDWVPFNVTVVEYIDIDADQQSLKALESASAYLEQGKGSDAAEALSEAGVEASITTAYLPIGSSLGLLEEARSFIDDERYHEANLALKSIEDSSRQDNYTITR